MPYTPAQLAASLAASGRRAFRATPEVYEAFSDLIDSTQGYPKGEGTRAVTTRGLPPIEELTVVNGKVTVSVEVWRISPTLETLLQSAIDNNQIEEIPFQP